MTDKTPKQEAEELLGPLLKGKDVHEIFSEIMRQQLTISGEPIDYWEEKFKLKIPMDNLTPALCKQLGMEVLALNQEATFHYAVATTKQQLIKRGAESRYMDKFSSLVEEYKSKNLRVPAAKTLETMATLQNDNLLSAGSIADIESRFWKNILEHLATCRKIIENASLNISVELKNLNGGNR